MPCNATTMLAGACASWAACQAVLPMGLFAGGSIVAGLLGLCGRLAICAVISAAFLVRLARKREAQGSEGVDWQPSEVEGLGHTRETWTTALSTWLPIPKPSLATPIVYAKSRPHETFSTLFARYLTCNLALNV